VVVVLPVPLTPTINDYLGWGGRVTDGPGDVVQDLLQLGFEELLEFLAALDAGAEGALAEVLHYERGGGKRRDLQRGGGARG